MLDIARQTIDFYTKYLKTPEGNDITVSDSSLLQNQGCVFVTIYKNGIIRGGAGNIKELKSNMVLEIIENTVEAISKDRRFDPVKLDEVSNLKIRIDVITERAILKEKEILAIDPTKNGILVIKNDYSSMATILPNISPLLLTGEDFIPILEKKTKVPKFKEKDFIIYKLETNMVNNF